MCVTFGVVDRIIILKEGYTVENLEFAVVGVRHCILRTWPLVHCTSGRKRRYSISTIVHSDVSRRKVARLGHVSGRSRRYRCVLVRFDWVILSKAGLITRSLFRDFVIFSAR